jgi:hypothetical protein
LDAIIDLLSNPHTRVAVLATNTLTDALSSLDFDSLEYISGGPRYHLTQPTLALLLPEQADYHLASCCQSLQEKLASLRCSANG